MAGWASRNIEPELLDNVIGPDREASLRDLERINRLLGGHLVLRGLLRRLVSPTEQFSFLDVGAGSGSMGCVVRAAYPGARVVSLDRQWRHAATGSGLRVLGDAFALPVAPRSFDFVFCSLFLHHFEDMPVVRLLEGFAAVARRAVLVIDLDRQPFAGQFIPASSWLFGWNHVTLHDAPASVRASFRAAELLSLARKAGLDAARVRRHAPWFRLSLVAPV